MPLTSEIIELTKQEVLRWSQVRAYHRGKPNTARFQHPYPSASSAVRASPSNQWGDLARRYTRVLTTRCHCPRQATKVPAYQSRCGDRRAGCRGYQILRTKSTTEPTEMLHAGASLPPPDLRLETSSGIPHSSMPDVECCPLSRGAGSKSVSWCTVVSSRIVGWCVEVCHIRSSQYARYRSRGG